MQYCADGHLLNIISHTDGSTVSGTVMPPQCGQVRTRLSAYALKLTNSSCEATGSRASSEVFLQPTQSYNITRTPMEKKIIESFFANPRASVKHISQMAGCHVREVNRLFADLRVIFWQNYNAQKVNASKNIIYTH
jgi:hypothetical protein